jgi:uncharacterized membrane-anchored protein
MRKRLALLAVVQLALVGLAVAPQLSARATGEEYLLEVRLVDPIDPFRGAYVDLTYPGLQRRGGSEPPSIDDGESGAVYLPLVQDGELWTMDRYTRTRPEEGPYLACDDRDWEIRCGIESWFVPEDEALALEEALAGDGAVATVKIDGRGNAAIVDLEPR